MFSIKALVLASAVSAGVVFAMPVTSQATAASVKIHTESNGVRNKSSNWWARHCAISNDVKCGRHYTRSYRHRHYDRPYYGHYRPYRHRKPGVNVQIY